MSLRRKLHRLFAPLIYREGTAVVPSIIAAEWPERQFLRHLLRRLDVDCVIDVGANVGQYARLLRLIGFEGTILSFEPSPEAFRELRTASASDANWHIYDYALGAEAGARRFNLMVNSDLSSFREPSTRETALLDVVNRVVKRVEVRVERLDGLLASLRSEFGFSRPFLKTDTQGFDLEVFRGASGIHNDLVGVQCELAVKRLYEGVTPWTIAIDEYLATGFELAGIFKVLPRELKLIECDCFFVRANGA
jgi:FkbM family methyltransferase